MTHIKVLFSHDKGDWISRLMAWFTYAKYTHVALVNDDRVIEASSMRYPRGVREVTYEEFMFYHPGAVVRCIAHGNPDMAWRIAEAQVGKDYDWNWLWGRFLRRPTMQDPDKFSCSELIAYACQEAGYPILTAAPWHVTPNDLYMVSTPDDQ